MLTAQYMPLSYVYLLLLSMGIIKDSRGQNLLTENESSTSKHSRHAVNSDFIGFDVKGSLSIGIL